MRPSPFSVLIQAGIYTEGSIDDGTRDIMQLTMALGKVVESRSFPPYVLSADAEFTIGDPGDGYEGLQPHPYYYAQIRLNFSAANSSRL